MSPGTIRSVEFSHPNEIAGEVRNLSGVGGDSIPDVREGYNAATGAGYLPTIALPGTDAAPVGMDFSESELDAVVPINSPLYRRGHNPDAVAAANEAAVVQSRARRPEPAADDYVSNSENFIDLDARIGSLGGHTVELKKTELTTIKAILSRAVQRQLIDAAMKLKKAYGRTVQSSKRKGTKVPKKRRRAARVMPAPSPAQAGQPATGPQG